MSRSPRGLEAPTNQEMCFRNSLAFRHSRRILHQELPQGWRWNQLWLPFGLTASHNLLHGGATRWPGRKTLGNEFPPSSGGPTMGFPWNPKEIVWGELPLGCPVGTEVTEGQEVPLRGVPWCRGRSWGLSPRVLEGTRRLSLWWGLKTQSSELNQRLL